nr:replication-relaxation family protein [Roseateles albus]
MPKTAPKGCPALQAPPPTKVDIRRTQRHLASLREMRLILQTQAPNGSVIYALSEKGARALQGMGIQASTGKDLLRSYHAAYFLHRNIANEVAIAALRQGYRVSTEREIAQGRWLGDAAGIHGKKPDVAIRAGTDFWFIEVERSHKNKADHQHLLRFLVKIWGNVRLGAPACLDVENRLRQVIFVSTAGFAKKLSKDLLACGWSPDELAVRVKFETSLYTFKDIAFY